MAYFFPCICPIHYLQDKPLDWYQQFHVIVLGLDSLEARRYMNSVACSFLGARGSRALWHVVW